MQKNCCAKEVVRVNSLSELKSIWLQVYASLSNDFSDSSRELWFGSIGLIHLSDKLALLTIPVDFKCNIIKTKYIDVLKEHFYACIGFEVEVDIITHPAVTDDADAEAVFKEYTEEKNKLEEKEHKKSLENDIRVISADENGSSNSTSYYTFDNFITGDSNKFAYAACYAIANNDELAYNPLFIHGKSGLGKTHLMYAIINKLFERDPSLRVIYIRGEEFTNHLIEAIKTNTTEQFREKYRTADILLVDDIQFIAGKPATQDEFFHTFDELYVAQKRIIVTCDRPIYEMKNLNERICTRFEWGLSADIQPPDIELRMAIIRKKAEEVKITLPEDVVEYLANKLRGNVRRIEGGVKKLAAVQFLSGKAITLDIAKQAIADFVPAEEPESDKIEKTLMAVCDRYNISKETILGKKRSADVVLARHTCMYILREQLEKTYEEIGSVFSCDHTTVMAAIKKIEREKTIKPSFADELDSLMKEIKDKTN